MAQYYNAEEVFAAILKEILENGSSLPPVEEFVEDKLKGFAEQYVFMRQVTFIDYLDYAEQAIDEQRRIDREHLSKVNATTPQEFWKLCMSHNYDTPDKPNQGLTGLIHTYALPPFPLGKIYGITEVWLIAKPFLLPFSRCDTPTGKPVTSYPPSSNTYIGGVIHPDGYPSQYREKTSEAGSQFSMKRKDKWLDPDALRRWYPLGGLAYKRGKHFELTGHMLVMDIDHGRDHHPWIILASEWPDLCGEGEDGESGKWTAKKSQEITPDFVPGVFPADTRRTPIARIDHTADASFAQRARSMLLNFGPNFEFDLLRKGGRPVRDTPKWKAHHPDLVHVAQWYYDAVSSLLYPVSYKLIAVGKPFLTIHFNRRKMRSYASTRKARCTCATPWRLAYTHTMTSSNRS